LLYGVGHQQVHCRYEVDFDLRLAQDVAMSEKDIKPAIGSWRRVRPVWRPPG
jgi:hypothetical protein